jgi:hypothetical protein
MGSRLPLVTTLMMCMGERGGGERELSFCGPCKGEGGAPSPSQGAFHPSKRGGHPHPHRAPSIQEGGPPSLAQGALHRFQLMHHLVEGGAVGGVLRPAPLQQGNVGVQACRHFFGGGGGEVGWWQGGGSFGGVKVGSDGGKGGPTALHLQSRRCLVPAARCEGGWAAACPPSAPSPPAVTQTGAAQQDWGAPCGHCQGIDTHAHHFFHNFEQHIWYYSKGIWLDR